MTGYGKAESELNGKKVTVELKTINSKQFDFLARLPAIYKEKEIEIRTFLMNQLERGKIELIITTDSASDNENFSVNTVLAKKYYQEISSLAVELGLEPGPDILQTILRLPEILKTNEKLLEDSEWNFIVEAIHVAIQKCNESRRVEGLHLESDITNRITAIINLLHQIEPWENVRIEKIRTKFRKDLASFIDDHAIDENRYEQEIIYYLEKIDITEEKVRLKKHCQYFIETMTERDSNGKKLNFISQEIGREINTIGSKANDSDIQKLVVQMKDELEKVKEQLFNIL